MMLVLVKPPYAEDIGEKRCVSLMRSPYSRATSCEELSLLCQWCGSRDKSSIGRASIGHKLPVGLDALDADAPDKYYQYTKNYNNYYIRCMYAYTTVALLDP